MKGIKWLVVFTLIITIAFTAMAQQKVYKLKPIKGDKSASIQSEDIGNGMTKWTVSLERLNGQSSEIYIQSDALVFSEGGGFNPPCPSNSVKVNSTKTADGFLFNGQGPKNNNIQIHLKKSSSDNSSYTLDVNLRQGEKYHFPIYYLPNHYLMVRGLASDYENMISSISQNQYFLEALSYLDDELQKYQGEENLVWWAMGFVGVFQDFVDVEGIKQFVPDVAFNVFSFESNAEGETVFIWNCGSDNKWLMPIQANTFIIVNSAQSCISTAGVLGPTHVACSHIYCPSPLDPNFEECMAKCESEPWPINIYRPGCNYMCAGFSGQEYTDCMNICSPEPQQQQ